MIELVQLTVHVCLFCLSLNSCCPSVWPSSVCAVVNAVAELKSLCVQQKA